MNYKQILFKGLPVLVVAVVVVVIAAIASKPKARPKVADADQIVFEYNDLKVTKGELYSMLKLNVGSNVLLDMIDRDLLAEFKDQVDMDELEEKIKADKAKGIDAFYRQRVKQGIIDSEDDPDRDEKIRDFYILSFLQKAYAKSVAREELYAEEEKTQAIQKAKDAYKEDMCIITIKYSNLVKAAEIEAELLKRQNDPATNGTVLEFFQSEYADQHKDDDPKDDDDKDFEELPFITEPLDCGDYERVIYEDLSSRAKFRDFVFEETYDGIPFTVEEVEGGLHYNKTGFQIPDDGIYFVYKLAKPKYMENYRESEEFEEHFVKKLVKARATDTYVNNQVKELREESDIKVYDTNVGRSLASAISGKFEPEKKLLKSNKNVVASYKVDGETKYITADQLYDKMKTRYSMELLIDLINYEALKTIKGIQLSKSERQEYQDMVKAYKAAYSQQPPAGLTWHEYLALYHGAFNEDQLIDKESGPTLLNRYLLGYNNFDGIDKVTDEDIQEAYEKWFSVEAYHILFEYDPEVEGDDLIALTKAQQVIDGCNDLDATCYIFYDINPDDDDDDDEEKEDVPFVGFQATDLKDWKNVFKAIATKYSDDPSAASNGGYLNYFGPDQMTKKFEEKVLEVRDHFNQTKNSIDRFGIVEKNEIKQLDGSIIYGYHVVYFTNEKTKTAQPSNMELYRQYLEDLKDKDKDVKEIYTPEQISEFDAYKTFENTLKSTLESKRTEQYNKEKRMAELREELEISFKDAAIQAVYENYTKLQKEYNPDAE